MNRERYAALMKWGEDHSAQKKILCLLNKILPFLLAIIYGLALLLCTFVYPVLLINLILRPVLCFLFVTVVRYMLKFPRPYDVYNIMPMCDYHPGKMRSFPSRHTACAAIIAFEIFRLWNFIGLIAIVLAILIGLLRIVCGNHFIKDVALAFGIAFLCSLV
ncbi:MAG: phosphatase PAP2 family protein [Clostridia bacterium]|nr:phosphatase PAP2 family protein [Lachnospiraceae bacterium]NCC02050.1 phosphatase PAP2 family protein [Clostridia bacterium]NCD04124.1 phosphatase PAP2 family protein [Clostridia bacterium]